MRDFKGQEIGRLVQIRDSFKYDTQSMCLDCMSEYLGTIQEIAFYNKRYDAVICVGNGWYWPSEMLIAVAGK